jgi:hypothetical protein
MASGSKPSKKTDRTLLNVGKGVVGAIKYTVTASWSSIPVPPNSKYFVLKNIGNVELRLNFNDDTDTNYYTLARDERTPSIQIVETTSINVKTIGGPTEATILFWG